MGLVLAIDPGRRQGKALDRLTQEFQDHEVVVATSGDEALAVLDGLVPDLVLFPLFVAPGDEAKLQARLDALASTSEFEALTLPLRAFFDWEAHATRPAAVPPRWFYWFKPLTGLAPELRDPRTFADAVRRGIHRPRAEAAIEVPLPMAATAVPAAPRRDPVVPPAASAVPAAPLPAPVPAVTPAPPAVTPAPPLPVSPGAASPATAWSAQAFPAAETAASAASGYADEHLDEAATGGGRAAVLAKIGPAIAAAWRIARDMPRALQVGIPAAAILLSLGVTGTLSPLISAPGRVAGATKARFFPDKPKTGTAEIQTVPDGAQVWYQGRQLGVTPLRTEFAIGSHEVELRYRNTTRTVLLDITPGNTFVQRVEWGTPRASGKLRVESDPSGAAVMIDGKPRGVTPLTVDDLAVGKHTVDVSLSGNVVHESVDVKAAKTATIRTSIYQGWLALFSPIDVRASADGRPLALDDQNRAMLPSGPHQLTLQNRALGYTETRTVDIKPGDTTPVSVVVPKTTLSVTTSGPADVWVDGEPAGPAPVTNFPVDIGTREVLVRSAEQGERRATVTATMNPVSVAIDFTSSAP